MKFNNSKELIEYIEEKIKSPIGECFYRYIEENRCVFEYEQAEIVFETLTSGTAYLSENYEINFSLNEPVR